MKFLFSTRDYVISHGKEPRGQGTWAFALTRDWDSCATEGPKAVFWAPFGTYAQAKKAAREHYTALAAKGGPVPKDYICTVVVCS